MNSFLSTCILLFLIVDPFGNLVMFSALLRRFDSARRRRIVFRECVIGGLILVFFSLVGEYILRGLNLSDSSLRISGGIMLFLIAIKMLFKEGGTGSAKPFSEDAEPFIVPLAMRFSQGRRRLPPSCCVRPNFPISGCCGSAQSCS